MICCYWTKKLSSSKAQWSITRVMKVEKQFEAIKKQKRTNTIQLLYLLLYTLRWLSCGLGSRPRLRSWIHITGLGILLSTSKQTWYQEVVDFESIFQYFFFWKSTAHWIFYANIENITYLHTHLFIEIIIDQSLIKVMGNCLHFFQQKKKITNPWFYKAIKLALSDFE